MPSDVTAMTTRSNVTPKRTYAAPIDMEMRVRTNEHEVSLLNAALLRQNSPAFLTALKLIIKSYGVAAVAQEAGGNRTALYKTVTASANPGIRTIVPILSALGLRLCVEPLTESPDQS